MYRVPNLSEKERLTVEAVLDLIEETDWQGADLAGEDLSDLDFSARVLEEQWQARGFPREKMPPWWSPADAEQGKSAGINLYRAKMETTVLRRAVMPGADLRGAVLSGAAGGGANLDGALLEGADLRGASFKGARFEGADLSRCEGELAFFGECLMAGANLSGGKFENAEFLNTDLRGADLRGAKFHGALFGGADLRDALLDGADFSGANLERTLMS